MAIASQQNVDKGGTGNTYENAVKESSTRLYTTAASAKNAAQQKSKLKHPSPIGQRNPNTAGAKKSLGAKSAAPVSAHNYSKSAGAGVKNGKKNSFQ